MYVDSSPVTARRSAASRHLRNNAKPERRRHAGATATARRTRLTDAIVSQWLLDQLPADHRHALRSASDLHR